VLVAVAVAIPADADARARGPAYVAAAHVDRLDAVRGADGTVRVRWHTTLELGVDALAVLRRTADGAAQPVLVGQVATRGNEGNEAYELADPGAFPNAWLCYEIRLPGDGFTSAPLASWQGIPPAEPSLRTAATASGAAALSAPAPAAAPLQTWIGSGSRVLAWTNTAPADRVRLSVREEGLYRVSVEELSAAMGVNTSQVTGAIAASDLSLSCQGRPVAWLAEGTNLYFYGVCAASHFAPENVYWLKFGSGAVITNLPSAWPDPPCTNATFSEALSFQGTTYLARVSYSSLADPSIPYLAFATNGWLKRLDSIEIVRTLTDAAADHWEGQVTVRLLSFCEDAPGDAHAATVSVGGTVVGQTNWPGEQYVSFSCPFSSTNLSGSNAALRILNCSAPAVGEVLGRGSGAQDLTVFTVVSCRFDYPRQYRAQAGALRCSGGTGNVVSVSGFATNDILILDVSAPDQPDAVPDAVPTTSGSDWTVSFPAGGTDRVYAVVSRRDGVKLPSVRGVRDVDWCAAGNAVDYAILIPPEGWRTGFREALQPLADFREQQGLRTRIVDVESLYNRFSDGLVDPEAIHAFCRAGRTNWGDRPLRYLLLAGAGALDYRHDRLSVSDYTACLIPTIVRGQQFPTVYNPDGTVFNPGGGMTVAADQALGDVDGDGAPEVAIGRLPTTLLTNVATVVSKTRTYEGALTWKRQVALVSDWDNTGSKYYPFAASNVFLIAALTNAGRTVDVLHPTAESEIVDVREYHLLPDLRNGSGLFHFFGHTSELDLGGAGYRLLSSDAYNLDNYSFSTLDPPWKPMIAIVVGCRVNRWQSLTPRVCILPYGLFRGDTGFAAAAGPTGYWTPDEGRDFACSLYHEAEVNGTLRLGDVLLAGLRRSAAAGVPPERLQCFCLSGDPALVFRHDITAMGTSVAWLNGLHGPNGYDWTAPNADLDDQDGDGWPTWREFQAGTDPTSGQLRVAAFAMQPDNTNRLTIAFDTTATNSYLVQRAPELGASVTNWQLSEWSWPTETIWQTTSTPIPPQGPRTIVAVPMDATNRQAFFRLTTTP
jgi:hypothetical protein